MFSSLSQTEYAKLDKLYHEAALAHEALDIVARTQPDILDCAIMDLQKINDKYRCYLDEIQKDFKDEQNDIVVLFHEAYEEYSKLIEFIAKTKFIGRPLSPHSNSILCKLYDMAGQGIATQQHKPDLFERWRNLGRDVSDTLRILFPEDWEKKTKHEHSDYEAVFRAAV